MEAVRGTTTSPAYVKVLLTDKRTAHTFESCVPANLFSGAVHREHGFAYDAAGIAAAERFITANPRHAYSFESPAALANMPWHPFTAELAAASALVVRTPSNALRESVAQGALLQFYVDHPRQRQRMAALACALIDQGLRPAVADMTGRLILRP